MTTHTNLYEIEATELARVGKYSAKEMVLSREKVRALWDKLSQFRTLFSDLTQGDKGNFLRFITSEHSMWIEIFKDEIPVGIACFSNMEKVIDTDVHILFYDRQLSDKTEIGKAIVAWMFSNFPLQRMTVEAARFYYATIRLAKDMGFKIEGEKRNAVLIGGRWSNSFILGITRQEVIEQCRS